MTVTAPPQTGSRHVVFEKQTRPMEHTIHPARRVLGAGFVALGAVAAVAAVLSGAMVLLTGAGLVGVGYAVSHRWTRPFRPKPTAPTRLVSERARRDAA